MAPVPFYFDLLSPYAYLAWVRARRAAVPLAPQPVLLSALLDHWGQLGPAEIPGKRAATIRDVLRRATTYEIALAWPLRHPFATVHAARTILATTDPAQQAALVDELFAAAWARREPVDDVAVVAACATRAGVPAAQQADATSPAGKARLFASNAAAIAAGVFGVPTFVLPDELLFGDDQLHVVLAKLAGRDGLDHAAADAAIALAPAMTRRRRA